MTSEEHRHRVAWQAASRAGHSASNDAQAHTEADPMNNNRYCVVHLDARQPHNQLRCLLAWVHEQWTLETPTLAHSVSRADGSGAPDMKVAAARYLRLAVSKCKQDEYGRCVGRECDQHGPDDWERTATKKDKDGFYVTPLRAAMTRVRSLAMRRFLHDLIPNAMQRPSDIAELHGVQGWAEAWVMQGALEILYREFHAAPIPQRSWVDLSDAQRNAVVAGDAA